MPTTAASRPPWRSAHRNVAALVVCFAFFAVGRWLLPGEARGLVGHVDDRAPLDGGGSNDAASGGGSSGGGGSGNSGDGGGGGDGDAQLLDLELEEVPAVDLRAKADKVLQLQLLPKASRTPLAKCGVFPLFFHGMHDERAVDVLMNSTKLGGQVAWANASSVPCVVGGQQRCCAVPFSFRFGATDYYVFQQIFPDHFLRALYFLFPPGKEPRYILDAGANAGFSTALFKLLFPQATVVSLEPDPSNFEALKRNTARFSKVHAVNAGLWGRAANITVASGTLLGQEWGKVFREAAPGEDGIPAYSVEGVARMFDIPRWDCVKIDIEGAEAAVFGPGAETAWVGQPTVVSLEVHDFFARRFGVTAVSGRVDAAFSGTDYAMAADNEHIFYMSKAHLESLGLKTTKPSALTPKPSRRRRLLRG